MISLIDGRLWLRVLLRTTGSIGLEAVSLSSQSGIVIRSVILVGFGLIPEEFQLLVQILDFCDGSVEHIAFLSISWARPSGGIVATRQHLLCLIGRRREEVVLGDGWLVGIDWASNPAQCGRVLVDFVQNAFHITHECLVSIHRFVGAAKRLHGVE